MLFDNLEPFVNLSKTEFEKAPSVRYVYCFIQNSNWNDERCESKMSGYICKAPKTPMSSTQGPFQLGCPKVR